MGITASRPSSNLKRQRRPEKVSKEGRGSLLHCIWQRWGVGWGWRAQAGWEGGELPFTLCQCKCPLLGAEVMGGGESLEHIPWSPCLFGFVLPQEVYVAPSSLCWVVTFTPRRLHFTLCKIIVLLSCVTFFAQHLTPPDILHSFSLLIAYLFMVCVHLHQELWGFQNILLTGITQLKKQYFLND